MAALIRKNEILQGQLAAALASREAADKLLGVIKYIMQELHSTRGVLAGERARSFQLQVEVFHLKQRLQSMENRAPTPRKPF
ncbi:hypothetical protein ACFX13_012522 [Malus domestica]